MFQKTKLWDICIYKSTNEFIHEMVIKNLIFVPVTDRDT